jgi:hypothetical protein
MLSSYRDTYQKHTSEHSAVNIQKKLNSELCKVQSFFHPEIFEMMMKVNSLKSHVDFEIAPVRSRAGPLLLIFTIALIQMMHWTVLMLRWTHVTRGILSRTGL